MSRRSFSALSVKDCGAAQRGVSLEQPDLDGALDCLAARRGPQLAVDGHGVRFDRVARDRQSVGDLLEGEIGRQERQHTQLGGGQAR